MLTDVKERAGIKRQIKLPNREAFKIALRSVKIRLWRSVITMVGIVLTIAFLSSVMTSGTIAQAAASDRTDAAALSAKATQVWLIAISLLICAVGITNAMLMSVTERYREIGTMKCLGALDWFVVKLFLIEAVLLGLIGSVLGATLGFIAGLLAGMSQYEHLLGAMPWGKALQNVAVAIGIGTGLAVIGAIYPARRAGKMPPADAMRTEI